MTKGSVLVPAYNEGATVADTLRNMNECVATVFDDHEIIAVDDGSEDDTAEHLAAVEQRCDPVEAVSYVKNRGKGFALRRGFAEADGDLVLFADADPDLDPKQIRRFIHVLEDRGVDVVVGSKRHPESNVEYPPIRRSLSRGYALLTSALFDVGLRDTQVGMKLFRREVLKDVLPLMLVEEFAFDIELLALARARGYEIAEAPIALDFQGDSSIDWSAVGKMGWDTLIVFYRQQISQYYDRVDCGEREPKMPPPAARIANERRNVPDNRATNDRSTGRRAGRGERISSDDGTSAALPSEGHPGENFSRARLDETEASNGESPQERGENSNIVR